MEMSHRWKWEARVALLGEPPAWRPGQSQPGFWVGWGLPAALSVSTAALGV